MNKILETQINLQKLLAPSTLKGHIIPPHYMDAITIGEKYTTISKMQMFLNQEIDELLLAIGDNSRNIHKPWKKECQELLCKPFVISDEIKGEAIDILCFTLNICIAAGITADNIEDEYNKVAKKILGRITHG